MFIFDTEEEMNAKEKEIVNEEFLKRDDVYNICPGGQGGFGYINKNGLNIKNLSNMSSLGGKSFSKKLQTDIEFRALYSKKLSDSAIKTYSEGRGYINSNPTQLVTPEANKKRSETHKRTGYQKGEKNSQFGKRRIKNIDTLEFSCVDALDLDYWLNKGWTYGKFANGIGKYVRLQKPNTEA